MKKGHKEVACLKGDINGGKNAHTVHFIQQTDGPIKLEAYKLPIFNDGKDATKANFLLRYNFRLPF